MNCAADGQLIKKEFSFSIYWPESENLKGKASREWWGKGGGGVEIVGAAAQIFSRQINHEPQSFVFEQQQLTTALYVLFTPSEEMEREA